MVSAVGYPLLDTASSTIASNIDPRQMQDIPLNAARSVADVVAEGLTGAAGHDEDWQREHKVDQILSRPRAHAPHVTFDFWNQFDAAQQLEELRLYRPSIYKALPELS